MHQEKITILFVISASKTNKKGLCPLNCRITFNKQRKQFTTGLFVNPNTWNNKLQLLNSKDNNSEYLNSQIDFIRRKILDTARIFQLQSLDFSIDDLYAKYLGEEPRKKEYVLSYYRQYLARIKKLIGIEIKENTYQKFTYVSNHLQNFIKWKFNSNDYLMEDLNLQFLNDFEYYLKTEKGQMQVTINKTIQRFRTPFKQAISEGIIDRDPFILYKAKKTKKEILFLRTDELKSLEKYDFKQPRLKVVRDLYIFCCYTGLAFNEMSRLEKSHIQKGFDGLDWIQMKREKTQRQIAIPLLPKAIEILEIYDTDSSLVFPAVSNQKFNSYLKEIGDILSIPIKLTHHTARKTFASTVLLYNDVPMEIVSELLGHSSITVTQESYGKVIQRKISEHMIELNKKMN